MDYTNEDFFKYKKYLVSLQNLLDECFENQKEYICCHQGCSFCCEKGEYPYSELEFNYLLLGFFKIPISEQKKVVLRIKNLKEEYTKCVDKKNFMYRCPFLNEENSCTVYEYRGLICRTFGLITELESGKYTLPFCSALGLNYSKIYNQELKKIDYDLVKNLGYKALPNPYKLDLKRLTTVNVSKEESLSLGKIKSLVEWL